MEHEEKLTWMARWASDHGCRLEREGECGFGRECVGIVARNGCYPDYYWYADAPPYDTLDNNGAVWRPKDAYHKHECVAVLGRGEAAEAQLYEWLKWFDAEGFTVEVCDKPECSGGVIGLLFDQGQTARMVKQAAKPTESAPL